MPRSRGVTRRRFIDTVAGVPALAALARRADGTQEPARVASGRAPRDLARGVARTEADLGSNFDALRGIDGGAVYPASLLSGRYPTLDAFSTHGRGVVLNAYGYRPAPVDPAPEIVDRYEGPDFVREKVVFSTSPAFRVPAYVFVPKVCAGAPRRSSICTRMAACSCSARRRSSTSGTTIRR